MTNASITVEPRMIDAATHTLAFVKMHGLGNDFVVVRSSDLARIAPEHEYATTAISMCDRRTGIGADGLLLVDRLPREHECAVTMRTLNVDGTEAETCGNGLRCVALFARDVLDVLDSEFKVQSRAGRHTVRMCHDVTRNDLAFEVDMGEPNLNPPDIPIETGSVSLQASNVIDVALADIPMFHMSDLIAPCLGEAAHISCVSMGNPHAIVFLDDVSTVPIDDAGPAIASQAMFPAGVNVHFVQPVSRGEVIVCHWERGAGATQACGSGACAVCVAGVLADKTDRRLTAHLPGGPLELYWNEQSNRVLMTGPAAQSFEGMWTLDVTSSASEVLT